MSTEAEEAAMFRWLSKRAWSVGYDGGWVGDYLLPNIPKWDDTPYSKDRGLGFHHMTFEEAVAAAMKGKT